MVLPLAFTFGKQVGYTTVHVEGATTPFAIRLPSEPNKVESVSATLDTFGRRLQRRVARKTGARCL